MLGRGIINARALPGRWLIAAALSAACGSPLFCQDRKTPARFDVVSIRQQPPGFRCRPPTWGTPGPVFLGGRYKNEAVLPFLLIQFAYPMHSLIDGTLVGLPEWTHDLKYCFDVEAKSRPGSNPDREELRQMMREVLASRFHLRFHTEMREMPVYFLDRGNKGTHNLSPADPSKEQYTMATLIAWYHVFAIVRAATVPEIARYLAEPVFHQPVVDRTGLHGYFDINFPPQTEAAPVPGQRTDPKYLVRSFLQNELGLELSPGKAEITIMVVDEIKPPTRN